MRDADSQLVWWVWWVWWTCSGRNLCLSPKVSATWNDMTPDRRHATTHEMTVYRSGRKHPTNLHQTHQMDRQRTARTVTLRENIRTVVNSRHIASHRAVPPGPICMWGSAAHDLASVELRHA